MEDQIIVIDKIEEAEDNKGKAYKKITDKAGVTRNFKEGRNGLLTNKGHLLKEGKAIKLQFQDYKTPDGNVFPFVKDFEPVEDVFVAQAAEKVQAQAKNGREDSIESQVAFKGMVELIATGMVKAGTKEYKATIDWAMARIDLPGVIVEKVEEAKGETDKQEGTGQKAPTTIGGFLTWLKDSGIKSPRTWLEEEHGVKTTETLTLEKCQELYEEIIKSQ